jgi:hypothetical protein
VYATDARHPERAGDHRLTVLDLPSGKELWSLDPCAGGLIQFSPDGRRLTAFASSPSDGKQPPSAGIKVLDTESGREIYRFATKNLQFASNGNQLVRLGQPDRGASAPPRPLKVWDLRSGTEVATGSYPPDLFESPGWVGQALSPEGTLLAIAWRGS